MGLFAGDSPFPAGRFFVAAAKVGAVVAVAVDAVFAFLPPEPPTMSCTEGTSNSAARARAGCLRHKCRRSRIPKRLVLGAASGLLLFYRVLCDHGNGGGGGGDPLSAIVKEMLDFLNPRRRRMTIGELNVRSPPPKAEDDVARLERT